MCWMRSHEFGVKYEDSSIKAPSYTTSGKGGESDIVIFSDKEIFVNTFRTYKVIRKEEENGWIMDDLINKNRKKKKWNIYGSDYSVGDYSKNDNSIDYSYSYPIYTDYDFEYVSDKDLTQDLYNFILEVPSILRNGKINKILEKN